MSCLLIYISPEERFDLGRFKTFLGQCSGISNVRENEVTSAAVTAHFSDGSNETLVDLDVNLDAVSVSGSKAANVQFAFLLQQAWSIPLHVINESYSFDLIIRNYGSASELGEAILAAENQAKEM